MVITALGLYILVPRYGYVGAAMVSTIAYSVSFVVMLVIAKRTLEFLVASCSSVGERVARVNSVNENLQESVTSNTESGAQVHTVRRRGSDAGLGETSAGGGSQPSHSIFCSLVPELAAVPGIELKVFFCCNRGAEAYFDRDFGTEVKWDIPLLDGYESEFLTPGRSAFDPSSSRWTIRRLAMRWRSSVLMSCSCSGTRRGRCGGRGGGVRNRVPVLLYSDSNAAAPRPLWKRIIKNLVVRHFYRGVAGALYTGDNNRDYHIHFGLSPERLFQGALPIDRDSLLATAGNSPKRGAPFVGNTESRRSFRARFLREALLDEISDALRRSRCAFAQHVACSCGH